MYDFKNIDEIALQNYIKSYDFETNLFSKPLDQATLMIHFLSATQNIFIQKKKYIIIQNDQPWVNSYTRLLLKRKNRNYRIFKKVNGELMSVLNKHGRSE